MAGDPLLAQAAPVTTREDEGDAARSVERVLDDFVRRVGVDVRPQFVNEERRQGEGSVRLIGLRLPRLYT